LIFSEIYSIIYIESEGRTPQAPKKFSGKKTRKNLKNPEIYDIIYIESKERNPKRARLTATKSLKNLAAHIGWRPAPMRLKTRERNYHDYP
jgi:hypothetical protein